MARPRPFPPSELEISEAVLRPVRERRLELDAAAEIAQQVGKREAAGLVEQAADGQRAGRVGELRLRPGEPAETGLQLAKLDATAGPLHGFLRPLEVVRLERRGQPFVEPGGNTARRERADQRVRVLVREHAIELLD